MSGPSIFRLATEVSAVGEFGTFTVSAPLLKRWLPRGDRPVFVMPGFLAGDGTTVPLPLTSTSRGRGVTVTTSTNTARLGGRFRLLAGLVRRK